MRPLNRPMFKMGGPIKEGIMSGMKEPQMSNTVGSPFAPQDSSGRQKYAIQFAPLVFAAGRALARPFGTFVARNVFGKPTVTTGAGGAITRASNIVGTKNIFQPNPVGRYLLQSPEGRFLTGASGKAGAAGKKVLGVGKSLAKSPLLVGGAAYQGFKALGPDEKPTVAADDTTGQLKRSTKEELEGPNTTTNVTEDPNKRKQIDEDRIAQTKKRYYELFELDKMKKGAVYDSLLDASNIVREEGADLKGALRSGTLQNRIINAISKNLDKSADIKRQIDAAILKGEIQKDVAKDIAAADTTDKEYKKARIKALNRAEKQAGASGQIAEIMAKNDGVILGSQTAAILRNDDIPYDGVIQDKLFSKFKKDNPAGDEIDFMIAQGKDLDDGRYVIGARLVEKKGPNVAFIV